MADSTYLPQHLSVTLLNFKPAGTQWVPADGCLFSRENEVLSLCCTAEVEMYKCRHWCAGHAAKLLFAVGCWSGLSSTATKDELGKNGVEVWAMFSIWISFWPQHAREKKRKKMQKAAALSYGCLEGAGGIRFKYSGKKSAVTHILIVYSSHFVYFYASKQKIESSDLLFDCLGLLSGCTFSVCLV